MEATTKSKRELDLDKAAEELIEFGRSLGMMDPAWSTLVAKVRNERDQWRGSMDEEWPTLVAQARGRRPTPPPLCLGCGARNHPDDHGALPCGH